VGIYNTETQSRNGDNHAVMMNVGVGVGGVALPQLQRRVFLPRVAFLTTRRASHHALLVIASRVSQTHVGNLQYRNAMSLCHIRAAVINVGVGVGVGGVALPQLRSVVVSYHALLVIASRVSQTHVGNLQYKNAMASGDNRAAVMNVGVGVRGVALPQLRSVVFSYHASCFSLRVVGYCFASVTDTCGNLQHRNAIAQR
jgi:uncharacterized membrane protein YbaN (DUF454 family)